MSDFFQYQGFLLLAILTFSFTGMLISGFVRYTPEDRGIKFLFGFLIGMLSWIFFWSIIKTGGTTILAGLIIPLIFLAKHLRWRPVFTSFPIISFIKWCGFTYLLVSAFNIIEFSWLYEHSHDLLINVPHFDFLYYAKISGSLSFNGAENRLVELNNIYPEFRNVRMPYHYPEIWLNSIFVSATSTSSLKCMMLLTYPLLKGGFVLLLYVYVKNMLPEWKPFIAFLLAIALGSVTGFYFPFYADSELLKYYDGITQAGSYMSFGRKYIFLELYAGFFIFFLLAKEQYRLFLLCFSIIPFFSIGTSAAIYGVLFVFPFILLMLKKITRSNCIELIAEVFLVALFQALFYGLNGSKELNNSIAESVLALQLLHTPDLQNFKTLFFAFLFPYVRYLIFYLPYLLLVAFTVIKLKKKQVNIQVAFIILLTLGGAVAAAFANGLLDSGQFFYNIIPLATLFIFIILINLFVSGFLSRNSFIIIFSFLGVAGVYHLICDYSHQKQSVAPYNALSVNERVQNLQNIEIAAKGKPIVGLFRESMNVEHNYSFLHSYYRNHHFYLQFADSYHDALNVDILPFLNQKNTDKLTSYLFPQNEFNIFLKRENLTYSPEALIRFYDRTSSVFFADGENLIIPENGSLPEIPLASLPLLPGD